MPVMGVRVPISDSLPRGRRSGRLETARAYAARSATTGTAATGKNTVTQSDGRAWRATAPVSASLPLPHRAVAMAKCCGGKRRTCRRIRLDVARSRNHMPSQPMASLSSTERPTPVQLNCRCYVLCVRQAGRRARCGGKIGPGSGRGRTLWPVPNGGGCRHGRPPRGRRTVRAATRRSARTTRWCCRRSGV